MRVISLPLPEHSLPAEFVDPASASMTFLRELWEAVQPLRAFYPQVAITIRTGSESSAFIDDSESFEGAGGYDPGEDHPARGWEVGTLEWDQRQPDGGWKNHQALYSSDFMGEDPKVLVFFGEMIGYLNRTNVVPEIADKLRRALDCLK